MKNAVALWIIRNSNFSFMSRIARLCTKFLKHYWNDSNWDFQLNGEARVLEVLKNHLSSHDAVFFDVGANHGDWSSMILERFAKPVIHCFEIVPDTFEKLKKTISRYSTHSTAVHLNPFGLSDSAGEVQVSYFPNADSGSSINPLNLNIKTESRVAEIRVGDEYVSKSGVDTIDFLKVDTEGHDLFVLKGLNKTLLAKKVKCIQFEYGQVCFPKRVFLEDFYQFLEPMGYAIGRVFPDGVRFKKYEYHLDEHFRPGNYIAVLKSENELFKKLQGTRIH